MTTRILRQIAYDNHLQTLRSLGVRLGALAAFDPQGEFVWSHPSDARQREALIVLHRSLVERAEKEEGAPAMVSAALPDGGQCVLRRVVDDVDGNVLELLLIVERMQGQEEGKRLGQVLDAVAGSLLNEYLLNKELETMASELTDRYEELNLVFQSDMGSRNMLYGFESLRRLVKDTTQFLNVGLAALLLPAKDLEIYDLDERMSIADAPRLLSGLRSRYFEQIRARAEAVVLNDLRDQAREGVSVDLPVKLLIAPVESGAKEIIGMLVIANCQESDDFSNSDRNLAEVMAKKVTKILQSNFDALTGLENSHSFEWAVGQSLLQARSRGLKHAILHVDIDRTNVVNDISGRVAGDELIRTVARVLSDSVRAHDSVARIGGDEFGILLETCTLEAAAVLAEKMSRRIESLDFEWQGTMHPLSVCIGVAPVTAETESVSTILSAAEVARDAAKEKGRNRIQVYEQNDLDLLRRRGEFQWVSRIQSALREDRFDLHVQVIEPLGERPGLPHYEVLVRMQSESGELVPPGRFMGAAEHYHLMPGLDRWVVGRVIEELRTVSSDLGAAPFDLSINLSGQSLSDDHVKEFVYQQLKGIGPLAANICFEITESAAISNMEAALDFIAGVRRFGCRFSLDDFGSGLSSFAYLQKFQVDYLKIDGSFVRRIDHDPVAASMVSAMNQVGQVMGLKTIAEFVETAEIADKLRLIGVDCAQGYHFGKPGPLTALLQELRRQRRAAHG